MSGANRKRKQPSEDASDIKIVVGQKYKAQINSKSSAERRRMLVSGKWRLKKATVWANDLVFLEANNSTVYGNGNTVAGDNNRLYGNNLFSIGNHNILIGTNNQCFGTNSRTATTEEEARREEEAERFRAARLFLQNNQEKPEHQAPPPPPPNTDAQVQEKVMPKAGSAPDNNKWKVSVLDIQGESRKPARPDLDCVVCADYERDVIFEPCGHLVCCRDCTRKLYEGTKNTCPQCRVEITFARVVYL